MTAAHRQIAEILEWECELRSGRRRADPLAIELGTVLCEVRQRLELAEENRQLGREPDRGSLPLFGEPGDG